MRDVVLRRIPGILGGNTLYAVPAILASGVAVVFHHFGMTVIGSVAAIVVGGFFVAGLETPAAAAAPGADGGAGKAARVGFALTVLGWVFHLAGVVLRGVAADPVAFRRVAARG